jgi:photosystem II stability/assembly factor-like uncharacterized protein
MKHITILLALMILVCMDSRAQKWAEMMEDPNISLFEVQREFNVFFARNEHVKGDGYNVFKRWEYWMERHVNEDGLLPPAGLEWEEYFRFMSEYRASKIRDGGRITASQEGNWTPLGSGSTLQNWSNFEIGIGRVDVLKRDPFNSSTFYAGTPSGGLWKSTNSCVTWNTTGTDSLPTMGVSAIVFHPKEPDHLFIATGDRDANGTRSIGLLESFDGGNTWDTTGLTYQLYNYERIYDLLIHPTNPDTMYAGTFSGLFRSYDGANSWTLIHSEYAMDIEFKPDDPSTFFVVYKDLWKSIDNGDNFVLISSGLPNTALILKAQIAVTQADPDVVYYHCCNASPSSFHGIYRSADGGNNFTVGATSPNMYGYDPNGNDNSGQTGYNMAIEVNPINASDVIIAGIRPWRSLDGGLTFSIMTDYTTGYVHSDVHWLAIYGNDIYCCSDGGISKTSNDGLSWTYMNNGLQITQYYRLGLSATKEYLMTGGAQDNGTSKLNGTEWRFIRGADGGQCRISPTDTNTIWASTQWGSIAKSYNGGLTFANVINPETGDFMAPMVMHPTDDDTLYLGRRDVWRTYDAGNNWTQISFFSTDYIEAMDVSDLNTDYIYVSSDDQTYMTADGGSTWIDIKAGLPATFSPADFEISEDEPLTVWLGMENYYQGEKVYSSNDGGTNWTNISGNLPNTPVNCIVHEAGSPNRIYIGTDLGVFVRDSIMAGWQPFASGMPKVPVNDLAIYYPTGKLRAATYGKGMWESNLYTEPLGLDTIEQTPNSFDIYPNPTTGTVFIKGDEGELFRISDLHGREVLSGKINVEVDLSGEAPGIYLITVNGTSRKLVLHE